MSQGLVSVFHFVMNIALVRLLEPAEYGLFALVFALSLIISSMSNALFTVPLSVLRPHAAEADQVDLERDLTTPVVSFSLLVASLAPIVGLAIGGVDSLGIGLAAGAFIATFAARTHARGAGYSRFDASVVLRADVAYVLVGASTLVALFVVRSDSRSATAVLVVLAVANIVSTIAMTLREAVGNVFSRSLIASYRPYWSHARWALVGAVATMLASQGHSLVISVLRDAEAFAPIAAGFVLFGPVRVLFATIQNVLRPEMARSLAEGRTRSAYKQAAVASAGTVAAVAALGIAVAVLWGPISTQLYAEQYSAEPMGRIVGFWTIASAVAAIQTGPNALLQALQCFAELARVGVVGAIVGVSMVAATTLAGSVPTSVLGVAAGEAAMAIGTFWLLERARQDGGVAPTGTPVD